MEEGQVIAGIQLGKLIGAGATGVVHAGVVQATGQPVAVKIVRPHPGESARLIERTLQEGRVGWAVRHPSVVRVYEWGMTNEGAAYIVMERLEGETLAERLVARGRLPADMVVSIARQVVRGLAAIHAQGGVHRDVKPENVFLCALPADRVKLLDLGIVHLGQGHPARLVRTSVGLVVGTLAYLAPEQARGAEIDARTDLYGLGATLYHALAGHPPHPEGDVVDVLRRIALQIAPPALPSDVPEPLRSLIGLLLSPSPDNRPADAGAVLEAVETLAKFADDDTGAHYVLEDPFPGMEEIAEHAQIRAGIITAVARAIQSGEGPPGLSADLGGLDRLKDRRRAAAARAQELRRQTSVMADDLNQRTRRLKVTIDELEAARNQVRERYLQSTAALMEIADSIEDIDRRYLRQYQQLEALQHGTPLPDGMEPGRSVPHCLAEMEALHQSRAFFTDSQAAVRARLRTQHRTASGLTLQILELRRELIAVESERQATLVNLEDALRTAEDEVLQLDREIEHTFLRLGFVVQAHHARRHFGPPPLPESVRWDTAPTDALDTVPLDPIRRPVNALAATAEAEIDTEPRARIEKRAEREGARPTGRASVNAPPPTPRARPSLSGAPPRPGARASVQTHGAPVAVRASVSGATPAGRASVNAAKPGGRASVSVGPPVVPASANGGPPAMPAAMPAARASVNGGRPVVRASVNRTPPPVAAPPLPEVAVARSARPMPVPPADDSPTRPDAGLRIERPSDGPTSPDRPPPDPPAGKGRHSTAEIVSPAFREGGPPPLPAEVWSSALDRRATKRVPCALRVEVRSGADRALLTCRDLSTAGLFLLSPRPYGEGERLELELHLPDGHLSLRGVVVHSQPGLGFGLRIERPTVAARARLISLLTELST